MPKNPLSPRFFRPSGLCVKANVRPEKGPNKTNIDLQWERNCWVEGTQLGWAQEWPLWITLLFRFSEQINLHWFGFTNQHLNDWIKCSKNSWNSYISDPRPILRWFQMTSAPYNSSGFSGLTDGKYPHPQRHQAQATFQSNLSRLLNRSAKKNHLYKFHFEMHVDCISQYETILLLTHLRNNICLFHSYADGSFSGWRRSITNLYGIKKRQKEY